MVVRSVPTMRTGMDQMLLLCWLRCGHTYTNNFTYARFFIFRMCGYGVVWYKKSASIAKIEKYSLTATHRQCVRRLLHESAGWISVSPRRGALEAVSLGCLSLSRLTAALDNTQVARPWIIVARGKSD